MLKKIDENFIPWVMRNVIHIWKNKQTKPFQDMKKYFQYGRFLDAPSSNFIYWRSYYFIWLSAKHSLIYLNKCNYLILSLRSLYFFIHHHFRLNSRGRAVLASITFSILINYYNWRFETNQTRTLVWPFNLYFIKSV